MFYLSCETNLWLEFWVMCVYWEGGISGHRPLRGEKEAIITSSLPTGDDQMPHLSTYDLGVQTFFRLIEFLI